MDVNKFSALVKKIKKEDFTAAQLKKITTALETDTNRFALLMVEKPWDSPKKNPRRASMLPFIQGLEKRRNNFNIYYSTFVDHKDFKQVLADDLSKTSEERQIVYICAHGSKNHIGDGKADKILGSIAAIKRVKRRPIEGIIVGSCLVGGGKAFESEIATKERGVNWLFGYNVSISWMASVFIELAIIEELSYVANDKYLEDFDSIVNIFVQALGKFDPNWKVGFDPSERSSENIKLKDAIVLQVRKKNDSYPYGNISNVVFDRIHEMQTKLAK
jgi:hypothetical protein